MNIASHVVALKYDGGKKSEPCTIGRHSESFGLISTMRSATIARYSFECKLPEIYQQKKPKHETSPARHVQLAINSSDKCVCVRVCVASTFECGDLFGI